LLLTIEKLVYGGDGLARTPADAAGRSMAVFLPFVLPGEQVEAEVLQAKPGFARGSVSQVIVRSPERIEPKCPYFQRCGGCHYQHIPYDRQLEYKVGILRETFQRVAKVELPAEVRVHGSQPWNYRNRTRLQVRTRPQFELGYFRFGSHEFLGVQECPISSRLVNQVLRQLLDLKGCECPAGVEELELFADADDERMLAWAFCGRESNRDALNLWAERVRREVPAIAGITLFPSRSRSDEEGVEAGKPLAQSGAADFLYRVQDRNYCVSAGSFFQVNRSLVDELVSTVSGRAKGEVAFDLYAGVGLFSKALAESFHHIFAVEASQTSYADLVQNRAANVKAVCARTEDYLQSANKRPDLIVMDPPRAGVGKAVSRKLVEVAAARVRYVSCDPATLARDLVPLLAAGYHIEEAHLFDLFPQTFHIESVMLLAR
jgi:23S rRNA (uracil1939-C5)-methyltransferase